MIDTFDNDAVAERVREVMDDVTVGEADAEFVVVYFPKGRPVTTVNLIASGGMPVERVRDALEAAQQIVADET